MPITLNHSNIGVQYNTGSNYIIETVKSDLYLRNEIYNTIVRDNIQTAPITPSIYIENTSNIYAIESYTYTGSANTADYTRVFPKNTVCDILIVGGGGAGGTRFAGGGGAGALIYVTNQTIATGTYTIKVGRGGIGTINGTVSPPPYTGETGKDSEIFNNSGSVIYRAKGGGGGDINAFTAGQSTPYVQGGSSGGLGPNFNNVGNNYISSGVSPVSTNVLTINGNTTTISPNNVSVYGNSGGGGCIFSGKYMTGGGGGAGSIGQTINTNVSKSGNGGSAISISITGSPVSYAGGGGGGGGRANSTLLEPGTGGSINGIQVGGNGGYLKASTTFNSITYPAEGVGGDGLANTGSGGGGSGTDEISQPSSAYKGGSGGSGIVIIRYLLGTVPTNNLLTAEPTVTPYVLITDGYYPRIPSTNSATWTDNGYTVNVKVSDPVLTTWFVYFLFNHIITSDDHYHSTQVYLNNGSTTYSGATSFKGNSGIAISIDIGRNIYPKRIRIAPRVSQLTSAPGTFKIYASNNPSSWNDNNHIDWVLIHSQTSAATFVNSQYTIISLSNTPSISYRYYTMVVMTLAGNYGYLTFSEWSIGGDEKFDGNPEGNSITHKTLNFAYTPTTPLVYDFTPYNDLTSWKNYATSIGATTTNLEFFTFTGVFGGGGVVGSIQLPLPSGYNMLKVNYNNPWTEPIYLYIDNVVKQTCPPNSSREYIQSYTTGQVLKIEEVLSVIGENLIITLTNTNYITNTYTLNFPVPTIADINNNSNIVLRGAYDISLSTMNSSIIPKSGQYIPKLLPLTTSNISIRYNLLNPLLDSIGAQWTYNSSNTNVYHMGNVGIGTKSPEYNLDVRGSIYSSLGGYTQTGLTTWSIASDRRIKENIVKASYEKCLDNVKNIELYNFNFKDDCVNTNDKHQLGFIAQEVQQVYPKAVEVNKMILNTNETIDDLLSLNTTQIDYTLYGAVKNLIEKIEDIDNELGNIERNI
jgi:hypothetical protein